MTPENESCVSVVIPNWNGAEFLTPCIRSILEQESPDFEIEIIVVDNGSQDDSLQILHKQFPHLQVIRNTSNLGFTIAVNQGLHAAIGEFVLVLNNDTVMEANSLRILFKTLIESPDDIAGVQPLLLYAKDSSRIDSCGIALERHFRARDHLHGESIAKAPSQNQEIWGACAACILFRRPVFTESGDFDPDFFSEWDDVDLCLRMRWCGFRFLLCPSARVLHHRSPTVLRQPTARAARHRRNQVLTMMKSFPPSWRCRAISYRLLHDLGMLYHDWKSGELAASCRAWKECIDLRSVMYARRRDLMKHAKLSPAQMISQMKHFMAANDA